MVNIIRCLLPQQQQQKNKKKQQQHQQQQQQEQQHQQEQQNIFTIFLLISLFKSQHLFIKTTSLMTTPAVNGALMSSTRCTRGSGRPWPT